MHTLEDRVAQHYEEAGLYAQIIQALELSAVDPRNLHVSDLAPVEEFHIGGRKATIHVVEALGLHKGQHVLDVGCGIGGAARYIAEHSECLVSGVDLSTEYIAVAKQLTELTRQEDSLRFDVASALDMAYETATFDAAISLHAAMNIKDRETLYSEIARVLKPGAKFCLFDVMEKNGDSLLYPVPWALSQETSYLVTPEEMSHLLNGAGFEVVEIADRSNFALDFFKEVMPIIENGPPPLGIHLLMGDTVIEKMKNVVNNIASARIAPVQMLAIKK